MASKTTAKAAAPKITDTPAAVDWDSLPDSMVVTYERATVATVDREETTPKPIKDRVSAAFQATVSAGEVKHFNQACGSADAAEKFLSFATLYAKSKGWTLRGKVVTDGELNTLIQMQRFAPATPSGSVVSYSVKEKETRVRLTEAVKLVIAKDLRKTPTLDRVGELAKAHGVSVQTVKKIAADNSIKLPVGTRGRKPAA